MYAGTISLTTFVSMFYLILANQAAWAYPEFIAYGYSSCLTCHYNGNGGGPLNDYGRALWSSEIASRAFYPKSVSDEDIAAESGFLGPVGLPFWLRPHINYRGIDVRTNPRSRTSDQEHFYEMQTDFGATLQNRSGRFIASMTMGKVLTNDEFGLGKNDFDHIVAREYFLRAEVVKSWFVYAGLMDKVFGLRNVDHTSYQRTYQGFNVQTGTAAGMSESEGVILQKVGKSWEVSANAFFGNPYDTEQDKQHGFSAMGQFDVGENKSLGASLSTSTSEALKQNMVAIHYRQQVVKGSAIMAEYGLIQDRIPNAPSLEVGSYNLIQALILLTRGYNLTTTIERYNQDFKGQTPDSWKYSVGFLMFPLPRFELRTEMVNMRQLSTVATPDSWALQVQIHASL